jgi:hypothetical protein
MLQSRNHGALADYVTGNFSELPQSSQAKMQKSQKKIEVDGKWLTFRL